MAVWFLGSRRGVLAAGGFRYIDLRASTGMLLGINLSAVKVDGHLWWVENITFGSCGRCGLMLFFSPFFPLTLGQDTLRYEYLKDWTPTQPAHSPLVGTFEVKSPFIDDLDFSKA